MNTVKKCQTAPSKNAYELFFNRMDEQLTVLDKKNAEAKADPNRLVEISTSLLPQHSMLVVNAGSRAIGIHAAPAGAAGLILGDPFKGAVC